MSLDQIVAEIKSRPGFEENVGMMLLHNGVVREWSRQDINHEKMRRKIRYVEVFANELKIGSICQEIGSRPGIFAVTADAREGKLKPGEDMLYLAVAGDIRENVLAAFQELLDRVKREGVEKKEVFED